MNDHPFSETLELALNLHPSAKRVFVVAQAPSVEGYDERIRSALSRFYHRVELTYIKAATVPAASRGGQSYPPPSVLLYTVYTPNEAAHDRVSRRDRPPPRGRLGFRSTRVNDLYIGSGVVGGMMRSDEATGTRAGEIARQILDGMPPERHSD